MQQMARVQDLNSGQPHRGLKFCQLCHSAPCPLLNEGQGAFCILRVLFLLGIGFHAGQVYISSTSLFPPWECVALRSN